MWFNRKKQPPIRSLIGEGTVLHGNVDFAMKACASMAKCTATSRPPTGQQHGLVISENARVHGKVRAGHVIINGEVKWTGAFRRTARIAAQGPRRGRCPLRNPRNAMPAPLIFTDSAAAKVADLVAEEGNPDLKLRVFVQGGGCSGFQYGFTFDEVVNDDDTQMTKNGVTLLIDAMSLQYLVGAEIDYKEDLQGAQFVIKNPNATTTCGCGIAAPARVTRRQHRTPSTRGPGAGHGRQIAGRFARPGESSSRQPRKGQCLDLVGRHAVGGGARCTSTPAARRASARHQVALRAPPPQTRRRCTRREGAVQGVATLRPSARPAWPSRPAARAAAAPASQPARRASPHEQVASGALGRRSAKYGLVEQGAAAGRGHAAAGRPGGRASS
jgi:iron-sulfur cluster insertion protein